jgi:hypothetical protein
MYAVIILEEALEDLRNIVAYIASENPSAAETLGSDLLGQAISLESLPHRGSRVKKRRSSGSTNASANFGLFLRNSVPNTCLQECSGCLQAKAGDQSLVSSQKDESFSGMNASAKHLRRGGRVGEIAEDASA